MNSTIEGCTDPPYDCYIDIWDHSHSVQFIYDDKTISSNNEAKFKPIYVEICNIPTPLDNENDDRGCNSEISYIESFNINIKDLFMGIIMQSGEHR